MAIPPSADHFFDILANIYAHYAGAIVVFETVSFVALAVLLKRISTNHKSTLHFWCLMVDVTSVFVFGLSAFLLKPLLISTRACLYIISYGPINVLGKKAQFYCTYVFLVLLVSHFIAVAFCVLYQYAQVASFRPLKVVFKSRQTALLAYLGAVLFYATAFSVLISLCGVEFITPNDFEEGQDTEHPLRNAFRHARGIQLFTIPDTQLLVITSGYALISVPCVALLASICWHVYASAFRGKSFSSSRTKQLQFALFKSVAAQSAAITLFYVIPVYVLLFLIFFDVRQGHYVAIAVDYIMASYGPINYVLIYVFMGQLRREVRRQMKRFVVYMRCRKRKGSIVLHLSSLTTT
ncbi:hypothetical protein AAVH_31704 [Aphelenchoides avenae]|nr:hypothetical protein AAVH_31704 [Aphelenchus avenae]